MQTLMFRMPGFGGFSSFKGGSGVFLNSRGFTVHFDDALVRP